VTDFFTIKIFRLLWSECGADVLPLHLLYHFCDYLCPVIFNLVRNRSSFALISPLVSVTI
ncbi:MAG: hypothetical protein LUC95_10730, partial [Lachnospiraceae bacterium]|nr:hypothetical protein [Lachnospiraceae bacterium]